jgi:hypothetical protein
LIAFAVLILFAGSVRAVPEFVAYQGVLHDTNGNPVDGSVTLAFAVYPDTTGSPPLWTESHGAVTIEEGLFHVLLGSVAPLDADVFSGNPRYLEINVNGIPLVPRRPMGSVAYAYRAAIADSVLGGGGGADDDWAIDGNDIYRLSGNVGIGTATPATQLHVFEDLNARARFENPGGATVELSAQNSIGSIGTTNAFPFRFNTNNAVRMTVSEVGNVGIGTHLPGQKLDVAGTVRSTGFQLTTGPSAGHVLTSDATGVASWQPPPSSGGFTLPYSGTVASSTDAFDVTNTGAGRAAEFTRSASGSTEALKASSTVAGTALGAYATGSSGGAGFFQCTNLSNASNCLSASNFGTGKGVASFGFGTGPAGYFEINNVNNTRAAIEAVVTAGTGPAISATGGIVSDFVRTDAVEITAGADLSERFDIGGNETLVPGMVVSIDPDRPGRLRVSDRAYDHTVVGVMSGAGGVRPGLVLGQTGSIASGTDAVALTGRVYVLADATFGSITPGDLLTTSDTVGHAMAAHDRELAHGSILGKAMTGLERGRGLVLVLVTLQ